MVLHVFRRSASGTALAVASLFGVLVCPARAAQHWVVLSTPHFEIYTDNTVKEGIKALAEFEQVRSFFLETGQVQHARSSRNLDSPVRIIAFRSEKEFAPYRLNSGVFAYYQQSRKRDYIVMQDINPAHYPIAVHEYTHLIVQHAGMTLPVWLNEGLADLYSSLEPRGDKAMVGRPLAGESQVLASENWLDLALLTSVTADSPYYNERNKMSIFYAQSWLLTHMLSLSQDYEPRFPKLVSAVAGGASTASALESVYGKDLNEVAADLRRYFRQTTVRASLFPVKLEKAELEPATRDLMPFEIELALADLLASHGATATEARRRLTQLHADQPANPEVEASLAYLYWQQGNSNEATRHFAEAFREGSTDTGMLYDYGTLLDLSDRQQAIRVLARALELKPDFPEARFALGMELVQAKSYGRALSTLSAMRTVTPDQAFPVFSALAYCSLQLKNPQMAREWETKAAARATTAAEHDQVSTFLKYLDSLEAERSAVREGTR